MDRLWQHPWPRRSVLRRAMLGEPWDATGWQQIRVLILTALALNAIVRRAGGFNEPSTLCALGEGHKPVYACLLVCLLIVLSLA